MTDPFVGPNERAPGTFKRKGPDGPPYVKSLTNTRKPTGNKKELLAACEARDIFVPPKTTVPELRKLLGTEPAWDLYGRPSGFGDPLENSYALRRFIERGIAEGLIRLFLDGLDPSTVDLDDADALDRLVVDAQAAADSMIWADRGTHVHSIVERQLKGQPWDDLISAGEALGISSVLQHAIVTAFCEFHDALGMTMMRCEMALVNDECRIAGTADILDLASRQINTPFGAINAGDAIIADIKTGDIRDKYAVQIVGYNDAVPYDLDLDQRSTWPVKPVDHVAMIYHMSMKDVLAGTPVAWEAIPVDLATGREGARICCEARDWPNVTVFGSPVKLPPAPKDRRAALMERYGLLNDTAKAAFALLGITKNSTDDEVQAALDSVDPFAQVAPAPEPRQRTPEAPTSPVDDDLDALRRVTAKQILDLTDDEQIRLCIIRAVNLTAVSILQLSADDCHRLQNIVAGFGQLTLTFSDDGTAALTGPDAILAS